MRTWERVSYGCCCGQCGEQLGEGQACLLIALPNLKRRLVRCETCAGQAPPDLPAHPVRSHMTQKMQQLRTAKPEWMPYKDP